MRIAVFLGRLFNVRSGEWGRLLLLYSMGLVTLTGCTWADAVVLGAFLQRVGVQYLPWVTICSATCSVGALFLYTAFADRMSNTRLLIAILIISGLGILLGLVGLAAGLVGPAYLLLFLVLQVPLLDVYNVHWATYVNGFYDIRAAKRIVPVLSTSARLAGILGGLSMPLMNRLLRPSAIIGVSVVSLAIMAILAAAMPRLLHEQRSKPAARIAVTASAQPTHVKSYGARLREGYRQVIGSPFLRWMALCTFSMTLLLVLLNYGASAVFQAQLKTTVAISDFLGVLGGIANLVVLPIQLFLLSRLITRLGLGNTSLVYPLSSLALAGSLAIAPGLGTAALAHLDRTALRNAFRIPIDNLFYNAVPQRVKARTRAFVGGLVVPIGGIAGGLLLLTPLIQFSWFLPGAMLALGLGFALTALRVRAHYGQALVDLLEQEDYSSLALQAPLPQEPAPIAIDPAALSRLEQKLGESSRPERTIFLAQLLLAVGGEAAVPIVGRAVRTATEGRLRASLVDVLVAAEMRGHGVRELYMDMLADRDGQVRLSAISGLEQVDGVGAPGYQEVAAHYLSDPEIEVRLRVLPVLLRAEDPGRRLAGIAELRSLLKSPDGHIRAQALRVVGQAHAFGFLMELVRSLTDNADEVRLAAGLATEALAGGELQAGKRDMLLALALLLLHDPVEPARLVGIKILDRLSRSNGPGASAARESLVAGLADPSPEVCAQAIEALVRAGRRSILMVQEQLDMGDVRTGKMASVVLARLEPRKYAPLILGSHLDEALHAIYRNLICWLALSTCPGLAAGLLRGALVERNAVLLDEFFYLLSTVRDPTAIESVARLLRSPQPEARANAAETLESLTTPQTAALVGPLFEPDLPSGPVQMLAKRTWSLSIPTPAAALRLLLGDADDPWQRTLAAAAIVELHGTSDPILDADMSDLLHLAQSDPEAEVRIEASLASTNANGKRGHPALTLVEKLIRLRETPFFGSMSIDQLKGLASVCEEQRFAEGTYLYKQGEKGGALYIVLSGRVGIEQEKRPGLVVQLGSVEAQSTLGEADFFEGKCCTSSAKALQDSHIIRLSREPMIVLARQNPDLSLELIKMLSTRLREANRRIAELTRSHSREMQHIFDELT
jgi:hypothetical protein